MEELEEQVSVGERKAGDYYRHRLRTLEASLDVIVNAVYSNGDEL